jgi:hypothetical protein
LKKKKKTTRHSHSPNISVATPVDPSVGASLLFDDDDDDTVGVFLLPRLGGDAEVAEAKEVVTAAAEFALGCRAEMVLFSSAGTFEIYIFSCV